MIDMKLLALMILVLLNGCSVRQSAGALQQESEANSKRQQAKATLGEQFGKQDLLIRLRNEAGIEQPFAWGHFNAPKRGIQVIGIGRDGKLKKVYCFEAGDGYEIKPGEHKLNEGINRSGDLELTKYLPDTEFPFDSKIVSAGDCKTHFILVWQAISRSLNEPYLALDVVSLRVIVEKHREVVSSKLEEGYDIALDQASLEDVNGDGKTDFLLITNTMQKTAVVWTVEPACNAKRLLFKYENSKTTDSFGGKDVYLTRDESHNGYKLHSINVEPVSKNGESYFEETEKIFAWDANESVFRLEKTSKRLKP